MQFSAYNERLNQAAAEINKTHLSVRRRWLIGKSVHGCDMFMIVAPFLDDLKPVHCWLSPAVGRWTGDLLPETREKMELANKVFEQWKTGEIDVLPMELP